MMRWAVAWETEPPLLQQCRDLLAHLVSATYNQAGAKCEPSDFIPRRESPNEALDRERAELEMWAIRHNASLENGIYY